MNPRLAVLTVFGYFGWEDVVRVGDILRIEDPVFGNFPLCVYNYSLNVPIPSVGWYTEPDKLMWIEIPNSKLLRLIL